MSLTSGEPPSRFAAAPLSRGAKAAKPAYEYRNRRTGASFRSACPCVGDEWELLSAPDSAAKSGKAAKAKKKNQAAAPDSVPDDGGDAGKDA